MQVCLFYPHSAPHVALLILICIRTEADKGVPPIICLDQGADWLLLLSQWLAARTATVFSEMTIWSYVTSSKLLQLQTMKEKQSALK